MKALCRLLSLLLVISGCNSHEVTPLDQALSSSSEQRITIAAKTKLDILFVVDESESMNEEQVRLAENFATFSSFIFDDLNNGADYRLAVVSMGASGTNNIYPVNLGKFVTSYPENNPECPANLPSVISPQTLIEAGCAESDLACQQEKLGEHFSCLAKVGTEGIIFEKGLEAMRSALSCNGPNGGFFGDCCIPDAIGQGLVYDPLCRPRNLPPQFLRPDALLMVVFITDEDDCSTFADAPDTPFLTCRASPETINNFIDANNKDGAIQEITQFYSNPSLCATGDPQRCYEAECTTASGNILDPVDCYFSRCSIRVGGLNDCRWQYSRLAPVSYYYDFLTSLKARPNEQILVANIAAPGILINGSTRLSFSEEASSIAGCTGQNRTGSFDMCCPNGQCNAIDDYNSCVGTESSGYSSWRYIDFMSMFGDNGLGWNESRQDDVQICNPDLNVALRALKDKVLEAVGTYCVARRPSCLVTDPVTQEARLCDEIEAEVASNYQLRLKQVCDETAIAAGTCDLMESPRYLSLGNGFTLDVNDPTCTSGVRVQLDDPPPAGSTTEIELLQTIVALDE